VDVGKFLDKDNNKDWKDECEKIVKLFHQYGIIIVKDPRVKEEMNQSFIDQMEKYYEQEKATKMKDVQYVRTPFQQE